MVTNVNDILIITTSDTYSISKRVSFLQTKFETKGLGVRSIYLGVKDSF